MFMLSYMTKMKKIKLHTSAVAYMYRVMPYYDCYFLSLFMYLHLICIQNFLLVKNYITHGHCFYIISYASLEQMTFLDII